VVTGPPHTHDAVDDAALVERVARGQARAFDQVVAAHYPTCLRFAWRQLGVREDAEEAVQDAFVRAHRALRRGTRPRRLRPWLMSIVANRCRSHGARWRRYRALLERWRGAAPPPVAPPAGIPDHDVDPAVRAALASLPASLREAFLLHHVEELTYEEMAAATGAGVSALKMRVHRAAAALVAFLDDAGEG